MTVEVYSRFRVGLRGIYNERRRARLIDLLTLPSVLWPVEHLTESHWVILQSSGYIAAYEQAGKVVRGLVDGSVSTPRRSLSSVGLILSQIALDDIALDAAKSSVVFDVAQNVSTPGSAASDSFVNQGLKGLPSDHNVRLLEKYQAVKKEDVMRCLKDYILKLFQPESSIALVVTASGKLDEISEKLGEKGFKVEKRTIEVQSDEKGVS